MPATELVIFQEADGSAPLREWLNGIPKRARAKCLAKIERLGACGHDLRRPEADFLRDGIHELRVAHIGFQHRILYFFHGRVAVVLSHGFVKTTGRVPDQEIKRALLRKQQFEENPGLHTFRGGI